MNATQVTPSTRIIMERILGVPERCPCESDDGVWLDYAVGTAMYMNELAEALQWCEQNRHHLIFSTINNQGTHYLRVSVLKRTA